MDLDTVTSVSNDLHQLIPQAHACVEEKKYHTLMDIEGSTLVWQQHQINKEISDYGERVRLQTERNASVQPSERIVTYQPIGPKPRLPKVVPKKLK